MSSQPQTLVVTGSRPLATRRDLSPITAELPARPEPLEFVWWPYLVLAVVWLAMIPANYLTGRAFRFDLAMSLWALANLLYLFSGKGMYQIFLFLVLPSVLIGVTDFFELGIVTVEMAFLIPALNLIPYTLCRALSRNYPERHALLQGYRLSPRLMLFSLACFMSAFWAAKYPTQALRAIGVFFVIPFFFYLYTSHAIQRLANVKQIATVIVALTAFYSTIMGIIQLFRRGTFAMIARNIVIFREDQQEKMWLGTYGEGKIISVWPDSASFGHVLCFSLPLAFGLALLAKSTRARCFHMLSLLLISTGILITGNRTDILGAGAAVALFLLGYWGKSATVRGLFVKFALLASIAVAVVVTTRESNGLRRLLMPEEWDKRTASSRTILMQEGIRMFKSSPLFGIGLDNFVWNQNYQQGDIIIVGNYAHNLFIQILAETGVVGFAAFLFLLAGIFRLAPVTWRYRTASEYDFFCFLFLIGSIVMILQGLVENSIFYIQTAALWWTGIGIWRGRAMEHAAR